MPFETDLTKLLESIILSKTADDSLLPKAQDLEFMLKNLGKVKDTTDYTNVEDITPDYIRKIINDFKKAEDDNLTKHKMTTTNMYTLTPSSHAHTNPEDEETYEESYGEADDELSDVSSLGNASDYDEDDLYS